MDSVIKTKTLTENNYKISYENEKISEIDVYFSSNIDIVDVESTKNIIDNILEDIYSINTYFLNSIKIDDIERFDIKNDVIKEIVNILSNFNSGTFNVNLSPVVSKINKKLYFNRAVFSFMKINNKACIIFDGSIHKYDYLSMHETRRSNLLINNRLFGNSFPFENCLTTYLDGVRYKSDILDTVDEADNKEVNRMRDIKKLFLDLFKEIPWITNDDLNMLTDPSTGNIQILKGKDSYMILVDEECENRPTTILTPIGRMSGKGSTDWPIGEYSIRDVFLKCLGNNWKVDLRSKKNRELVGKSISELDWNDQEFLNLFTSLAVCNGIGV